MNNLNGLNVIFGNHKVILLNPVNGCWVRMPEERYEAYTNSQDNEARLYKVLNKHFNMFKEPEPVKSELRSLYFSVTGRCNLRCSFCSMNSGPDTSMETDFSLTEIEEELIPKLLGLNLKKIVITGGEPLCRPDIIKIIRLFSDYFGRKRITLQTNGLLLDDDFIDKVQNHVSVIEISIENIFSNNKLLQKMEGIFAKVRNSGITLSLSFVVDTESHQYLKQAIDICYKYDAAFTMRIVSLVGRANEENASDHLLEPGNQLKIHLEAVDYIIQNQYFTENLVDRYFFNLQTRNSCGAFGKILAIHPNGDTYMCGNFKDEKFSMGSLRNSAVEEITENLENKLESRAYQNIFYVTNMPACKNCNVKYFCPGHCPAEAAESTGEGEFVDLKCFSKKAAMTFNMFYYDKGKTNVDNLISYQKYLQDIIGGKIVL